MLSNKPKLVSLRSQAQHNTVGLEISHLFELALEEVVFLFGLTNQAQMQ
jgi:hypothetical protein